MHAIIFDKALYVAMVVYTSRAMPCSQMAAGLVVSETAGYECGLSSMQYTYICTAQRYIELGMIMD